MRHDQIPHHLRMFRRAWAIVTAEPTISRRALARRMGLRHGRAAHYWVDQLITSGYVERPRAGFPGLKVIVPLITMEAD